MWRTGGLLLRGLSIGVTWDPDGPTAARCIEDASWGRWGASMNFDPRRLVPDPGCGCGLWALRTPSIGHLRNAGFGDPHEGAAWLRGAQVVFGRVKLWGAVMEYERGWRSEYARAAALYRCWDPEHEEWARSLAEVYGVSIEEPPEPLATQMRELWERKQEPVPDEIGAFLQNVPMTYRSYQQQAAMLQQLSGPPSPPQSRFHRLVALLSAVGFGAGLVATPIYAVEGKWGLTALLAACTLLNGGNLWARIRALKR